MVIINIIIIIINAIRSILYNLLVFLPTFLNFQG